MSLWKIAWRSLQQRGLSSFLTGASVALGVTLMVAILVAGRNVQDAYESGPALNHNLLIGPKGSATQLVMNTVYHIDTPIKQTLPWSYYQEFLGKYERPDKQAGKYSASTGRAIPVCKGDAFNDVQVVATTPDFFKTPKSLAAQDINLFDFAEGQCFQTSDFFTGVIGSMASRQLGLKVGDKFRPSHAAPTDGQDHSECNHDEFTIVGVLKPTGSPNDRAIFINIEGFFLQEGHVNLDKLDPALAEKMKSHAQVHVHKNGEVCNHDHHDPLPDELRQVSAILLQTVSGHPAIPDDAGALALIKPINDGNDAQAVQTNAVSAQLSRNFIGPLVWLLMILAGVVVFASAVSILVSIYNSMQERMHDLAVLRALGARRETVMMLMFVETMLLALLGGIVGWFVGHLLLGLAGPWLTPLTGITFTMWQFSVYEAILIPGLILLAGVVGYLPAVTAYKTDVAKALAASP